MDREEIWYECGPACSAELFGNTEPDITKWIFAFGRGGQGVRGDKGIIRIYGGCSVRAISVVRSASGRGFDNWGL